MPVFRLDLGAFQNGQIKLFSERGVIGFKIKLPMLGQDDPVDGDVSGFDSLTVVLNFCATVVGFDGVRVQVDDHANSFTRSTRASTPL